MQKTKIIISSILMILFWVDPIGYTQDGGLKEHLVYMFFHGNIFHLFMSIYAVWLLKMKNEYIIPAYIIAVLCSLLCYMDMPTVGFSGFIYSVFGMNIAEIRKRMNIKSSLLVAFCLFIGILNKNINFWLHISCFAAGYLYNIILLLKKEYELTGDN